MSRIRGSVAIQAAITMVMIWAAFRIMRVRKGLDLLVKQDLDEFVWYD